jgi:myo-inositol-1(or 4)-monophosphatase
VGGTDSVLRPDAASLMVSINLEVGHEGRLRASDLLARPGFYEIYQPRVPSTTEALAWVAAGRHAAYLTEGDMTDNVHFAAGIGLCRAAGCVVTDLDGGPVGSPGRGGLLAAADEETHAALLALVREWRTVEA